MTNITFASILQSALLNDSISPDDGVFLLRQTHPEAIAQIQFTANQLRQKQVGNTVTYVINRNINFTNTTLRFPF